MSSSAPRRELHQQWKKLADDESSRGRRHRSTTTPTLHRPTGDNAANAGRKSPGAAGHRPQKRHATAALGERKRPVAMAPRSPKASSAAGASSSRSAAAAVQVGARVLVRTPVVLSLSAVVVAAAEDGYLEVVYDDYPPDDPLATVRVAVDQIITGAAAPRRPSTKPGEQL